MAGYGCLTLPNWQYGLVQKGMWPIPASQRLHAIKLLCLPGIFPVALTPQVGLAGLLYTVFSVMVIFYCPADRFRAFYLAAGT